VLEGDSLAGENNEHLHKIKVFSWKGPFAATGQDGAGWLLAENWWTYQTANFVTPPFAGYYSGHSTYSRTGAEIMTLITGDEYFPGGMSEFVATQDEYLIADDGPSTTVKLQWATYRDASDQCSVSRIYGGLHPPQDDIPGRRVGLVVGPQAVNKANEFIHANPPQVAVTYSAPAVSDIHVGGLWYMDVQFDKPMDTLVAPQLIFLNAETANTLTFSAGFWLNNQAYRSTYAVVDLNVTLTNQMVSIQQARDSEGVTNVPAVGAPFTIDTQNPAGVATIIGAESVLNELSVSTNAEVDLFIEFNEPMDQNVTPQITLLDIANNAGLTLSGLSDWTSTSTYHAVFTLTDTDAEIMDADVEISGAKDAAGNDQFITMLNDAISIDTRAPQALVTSDIAIVTEAEIGSSLHITVACDSPMNTATTPILVFNGINESENFEYVSGTWGDATTFTFTYTVLDGNIQTNAQIVIAGSTDENGNVLNTTGNNDELNIDTENPTLASAISSVALLSDNDVAAGLTVDLVFSEEMNTLLIPVVSYTADNPLAATLSENSGQTGWVDATTYRLVYTALDAGEELENINIAVSGVSDANGNPQTAELIAANIFSIDTRNPLVLSMTPSTTTITTSDVGAATFSVNLEFDEDMDESTQPAIAFSSTPSINFIASNTSAWNSSTDYSAVYDIPNATLLIDAVDMTLAFGASDLAGNAAQMFTVSNAFSVDVVSSVPEWSDASKFSIYPNPTNGSDLLQVSWPTADDNGDILIYNSLGQRMESIAYKRSGNPIVINVTDYTNGTYYLRFHSSNAETSLPFIVTH
jgi:hypothetical protein